MLELAHERRFAVSQLGRAGLGFEVQHCKRITMALDQLHSYFMQHSTETICRPSSPCNEYLHDFNASQLSYQTLPALDISDVDLGYSPQTTPTTRKPSRASSIAIQQLMNPVPTLKNLKRKASPDWMLPILPDDHLERSSNSESEMSSSDPRPSDYSRAEKLTSDGRNSRTRRLVRMRNSHLFAKDQFFHESHDRQIVEDGHLLLSLSRG
jgi:hypothetical protein